MTKLTSRSNYQGRHILAAGVTTDTDAHRTRINNNVLVIGPPGSGKTRHYIGPNLAWVENESLIISDTKGSLYHKLAPVLKEKGYLIRRIDFTDMTEGSGYNPLDGIRIDPETGCANEPDILTLSHCIVTDANMSSKEPFWDHAARQYLECLLSYVVDMLPESDRTLVRVQDLLDRMNSRIFTELMREVAILKPQSAASRRYKAIKDNSTAEKMDASIRGILSSHLNGLSFREAATLYQNPDKIDFASLGRQKTAVFLTVSDTDRSLDKLADMFMTQALQTLCRSADHDYPEHCRPVPVRFYLDDFATNLYIPDFDKIISVIRSREIYVSVILQSLTQLDSLYGEAAARTIINNCDQQIYLGGQDIETAKYISERVNRTPHSILTMPIDDMYVFIRGRDPLPARKHDAGF